ncbi:MAG: helicase [Roseiflexus sp.]|nr:helicase [Roseiflexus sp.]
MQSISDIIQAIARQRARGDSTPLIMLRVLDAMPGERVSHLPIDPQLAQAWLAYTGEPFRPHQAHALAALRRGEPVALRASSVSIVDTLQLLARAALAESQSATVLALTFDDNQACALHTAFEDANQSLPRHLHTSVTMTAAPHVDPSARLVIATPEALHSRVLRHHARAWSALWSGLRLILVPDVHRFTGVAGAHLADLFMRAYRVAAAHGASPGFLASLIRVSDPSPALSALLGRSWRVVDADDGPRSATVAAIWQGGSVWLRETVELVTQLRRQSYRVHVLCDPLLRVVLAAAIGDSADVTVGPDPQPAQVLVCAGFPGSISAFRRLLASGHQAVIVVLGELPQEQALARQASLTLEGPLTTWVPPPTNVYVLAQHIMCAASELPLTAADVDAWGCAEIVARMVANQQLIELPDSEPLWIPAGKRDPYAEFSVLAASGGAIAVRSEQPRIRERLDPTLYERWAFAGAALPPGIGGLRVVMRDEEEGSISLRLETSGRRTYPLRRGQVAIREMHEERVLFHNHHVARGRVVAQETIYGWRELSPGASPVDTALTAPLETRWVAPACWFDLPVAIQVQGQFIGWCITAAVTLHVLASFTDLVPFYDHERRRLFFIDAQPGGNGLAQWLYQHAEDVVQVAYDVALACRADPLLEPLSRVEQDWLLALLGRASVEAPRRSDLSDTIPPVSLREHRQPAGSSNDVQSPASSEPPSARIDPAQPSGGKRLSPQREAPQPNTPSVQEPTRPSNTTVAQSNERSETPDAAALIERLRRQREQRERAKERSVRVAPARETHGPLRFAAGDRIFCLPYGDGEVIDSRIEDGREMLTVRFPEYGELTIDPALSLVRKLEPPSEN